MAGESGGRPRSVRGRGVSRSKGIVEFLHVVPSELISEGVDFAIYLVEVTFDLGQVTLAPDRPLGDVIDKGWGIGLRVEIEIVHDCVGGYSRV